MNRIKVSQYNFVINLNEDSLLLYNSRNNNLIKLEEDIYFYYIIKISKGDVNLKTDDDFRKIILTKFLNSRYKCDSNLNKGSYLSQRILNDTDLISSLFIGPVASSISSIDLLHN